VFCLQELGITALHIKLRATGGNKTKTPGPTLFVWDCLTYKSYLFSQRTVFFSHQISQQYFQPWLISQTSPSEQGAGAQSALKALARSGMKIGRIGKNSVSFQGPTILVSPNSLKSLQLS